MARKNSANGQKLSIKRWKELFVETCEVSADSLAHWRTGVQWLAAAAVVFGVFWLRGTGVEAQVLASSGGEWQVGAVKTLRELDLKTGSLQLGPTMRTARSM